MILRRAPRASLRPFVRLLWASDGVATAPACAAAPRGSTTTPRDHHTPPRERMLPAGTTHLALRLDGAPARVFADEADLVGHALPLAVVGGPRAGSYIRDATPGGAAIGVELEPGAAGLLFAGGAHELASRHTALADLWGAATDELRDRLSGSTDLGARLDLLERALAARLPRVRGVHPVIAHALARFADGVDVGVVARETGYSHRHFGAMFLQAVGLSPRTYCRVRRFSAAVAMSRSAGAPWGSTVATSRAAVTSSGFSSGRPAWAAIAAAAGYADQPHLTREFRALAGMTPGAYASVASRDPRHVPMPAPVSSAGRASSRCSRPRTA